MTVRWKPLLILSGLFVAVALGGLMSFALYKNSRGTADILARARVEVEAKQFDKAKLDYQRALKLDGKNAALHEEMADFYETWSREAPEDKKNELRGLFLKSLTASTGFDTRRVRPRRRMLAEAIRLDDAMEQIRWARDLVSLEPTNRDAHYILAADALDGTSPNIPEIRRHLAVLETELPRRARTEWVSARTAALTRDGKKLDEILGRVRGFTLPADADPVDRMALLRLRALDVACTEESKDLAGLIDAVAREALFASSEVDIPSTRIARVCRLIEEVQKLMLRRMLDLPVSQTAEKAQLRTYGETLEVAAEQIFQKSLVVKSGADLNVYLAYADHLRFRERRDRCLVVVQDAFKSPSAAKQAATEIAMGLHALAVEASLANLKEAGRYAVAEPHIKALLECKFARFQALGHLFQGAIDLEKAGMVTDAEVVAIPRAEQTKLRSSALAHLKVAANQLPTLAEAQARYGVALILNQEPAMGRQYLQLAQRLGNLESQYQIWAAWSVVQAGYPEDAEPIVARMLEEVRLGRLPTALEGTLHLLKGEIHQSRRSPADLRKAIDEYGLAFANGQDSTPAVELRLAQMEIQLDRPADALKRIDWLVSKGKGGPSAENLAILTLQELKRDDDARKRLADARAKYPESSELAVLEASQLAKAKKPEEADRVLIDFLAKVPDSVAAVQLRAQILVQDLNRPAEARNLLNAAAERSDNSSPLVQLALLDLAVKDYPAVSASIAKIRDRWKDAATGDLLDAQLALARNDMKATAVHFDAALKKDPNNKIVQFWKAQLEGRTDPEGASKIFEALAKGDSIKEVETGLSIATASQGALAGIAVETGDLDSALARYREMLKADQAPGLSRAIRWQIVAVQVAKKEWTAAKREIDSLLKDPASPATSEELVRAATFYRLNKEDETALKLADQVLKTDPTYPGAVVTRAEIMARAKKPAEALATIQKAIDTTTASGIKTPPVFYLMMAAVETTTAPLKEGYARALVILERGIEKLPDSEELVQAKIRVLTITQTGKAGIEFVEEKARANPNGPFRRMLLATYAEQSEFVAAEKLAAEIARENPTDALAAAAHVRMIAGQSIEANRKGDRAEARRLDEKASALIYDYRSRFKNDWTFLQLECEVELRRGDTTRALALTQELDSVAKNQAAGPLLRAQIFALKGQTQEAAAACAEALARNPRLPEARLQLARLSLKNGKTDEALRQARFLQDADPDKPTGMAALLVETRAIALQTGTLDQVQANRGRALEKLAEAIRNRPDFADAYYQTADIHLLNADRAKAVAILKDLLKLNPDDPVALTTAIAIQAEPRAKDQPATKEDLDAAIALAKSLAENDPKGNRMLAVSNGFSRAGQLEQAIPWAEKAAAKLDSIPARLNLGDLLLTLSEKSENDSEKAGQLQDRALAEFDKILAVQPNTIAAVNNKAWILHRYKHDSKKGLELARGLMQRVPPSALPGEFYDTLGSIQEAMNQPKDAEESYKKGLGKLPEHPVLNLHMGALMANDPARARKAAEYLKVAQAGSDRLPTDMAALLNTLLRSSNQ